MDTDELSEELIDLLRRVRRAGRRGLVVYRDEDEDAEELEAMGFIKLFAPPECSHGVALAVLA